MKNASGGFSTVRNADQTLAFGGWESLPQDLGHVVEFGAGPYMSN